jgi:quinohemoprotein amine dehydrogenase
MKATLHKLIGVITFLNRCLHPKRCTLVQLVSAPSHTLMKPLAAMMLLLPLAAYGQAKSAPSTPDNSDTAKVQLEEGIPVTNQLVIDKCSGCHTKDAKSNLLRISWERTTPEGWEEAIKRMVRLRGVSLTPEEARSIVKYLSANHGLAPEEALPVLYYAEKRMVDETIIPNDKVRGACVTCHPFARPLSWRRSAPDWKLLANLHIALYPQADEAFRFGLRAGEEGEGGAPDKTVPLDAALSYLDKAAPLQTPEWAAWRARMRAPKLEGRWLVSAEIPGKGKYFGEMVVEPSGSTDDEFTTRVTLKSAKDGSVISRSGHSLVYTGYAWRGHSKGTSNPGPAPDDLSRDMREVMSVAPDQLSAQGRWFWGQYEEFGMDVKLQRATSEATLIGIDRLAVKAGSKDNRVRIIGDNLPDKVAASDLDFGSGITVDKIVSHSPGEMVVEVSVASDALSGKRDIAFRRSVLPRALAVYDRVDYIRVIPDSALARLGSGHHPKGFQQFQAIGYQRGEDDKLHTADDVELGPVDVEWSVEEFYTSYGDDDKKYVGTLSPTGLFTPASDGPNPARQFSRNNYGDVWVVATARSDKGKDGRPLVGKSYLVVTVPTYMQWDQPEVGQ